MLTAKGRDTEVAKGLAVGADAYITKPFATRELLDTIQRLEEVAGRIFSALRENARQQQARQAGAAEYDSWLAAAEYDSWFTGCR